jgi:RHS repeat-associated protein
VDTDGPPAIEGRIYWDGQQIAFRFWSSLTYFDHQGWEGTDRARTDPWGNVAATYTNLPFGDGSTQTVGGTGVNQDNNSFTSLELDPETETYHAQFRQYGPGAGSRMSPDPYSGSYDMNNPQSFNRYSYVLNNPLTFTDPSGLDGGGCDLLCTIITDIGTALGIEALEDLFGGGGGPTFQGSLKPRPSVPSDPGSFGESLGIPTSIPQGNWGIGLALNLPPKLASSDLVAAAVPLARKPQPILRFHTSTCSHGNRFSPISIPGIGSTKAAPTSCLGRIIAVLAVGAAPTGRWTQRVINTIFATET